jgi:glycosyltransferase involved in cell wall biosynthesis
MKILTVLTYYRPHTSGLTIYAERLARAFARRGHHVTVMTGIKIIRVPVTARVSKGVIAPTFGLVATRLVAQHDVVQMHLPQFDAPGVALRGRLFRKPAVLTYHCDLLLPPGLFNRFVNTVVDFMNNTAGILSNHIVTYTQDYADNSPYLSRYASKLTPILPPVELPNPLPGAIQTFAEEHHVKERRPVIGMVTRFASEKGVEILLDALPAILKKYPNAQVLYAGQHQNVMGEQAYFDRLSPRIREYENSGHWKFLGNLDPVQLAALYPNLDVLTVPSLNSTEAFGLVQIEAMMNGVPCVPSALPGVRQPVTMHGMGRVSKIGDSADLAESILEVLNNPHKFKGDIEAIKKTYNPDSVAQRYEKLFAKLMG